MAKLYMKFDEPTLEDGKVSCVVKVMVVGGTQVAPELRPQKTFIGEPTAATIIADMRALALQEANIYLTGKLVNNDIVMFCAPT